MDITPKEHLELLERLEGDPVVDLLLDVIRDFEVACEKMYDYADKVSFKNQTITDKVVTAIDNCVDLMGYVSSSYNRRLQIMLGFHPEDDLMASIIFDYSQGDYTKKEFFDELKSIIKNDLSHDED
jgi:hypothetical protein